MVSLWMLWVYKDFSFPYVSLKFIFISLQIAHIKTPFQFPCLSRLRFIFSRSESRLAVIGFQDVGRCLVVTDDLSCNQVSHYFIGAAIDWLNSSIHISFCNWVLPHVSPASMELYTLIGYSVL